MSTDLAALLERQVKERAALVKQLDETREARAWERAKAEVNQPTPRGPSWATGSAHKSPAEVFKRHAHNIELEDRKRLTALDTRHAQERRDAEPQAKLEAYGRAHKPPPPAHAKAPVERSAEDAKRLEEIRAQMRAGRDKGRER